MPVQLVLRPDQEFRGYAGQIASGTIRPGDTITAWPSGWTSRVARIVTWDGDLEIAHAPMSVTLVLEDELDISRGDVLAVGPMQVASPLHGQRRLDGRTAARSVARLSAEAQHAHRDRGSRPRAGAQRDRHADRAPRRSRSCSIPTPRIATTGSFVLIDPATNFTAGAGMILRALREDVGAGVAVARPSGWRWRRARRPPTPKPSKRFAACSRRS